MDFIRLKGRWRQIEERSGSEPSELAPAPSRRITS